MKKPNKDSIRKNIISSLGQAKSVYLPDSFNGYTLKKIEEVFKRVAMDNNFDLETMELTIIANCESMDDILLCGYKKLTSEQIEKLVQEEYLEQLKYYNDYLKRQKLQKKETEKKEKELYEKLKQKSEKK